MQRKSPSFQIRVIQFSTYWPLLCLPAPPESLNRPEIPNVLEMSRVTTFHGWVRFLFKDAYHQSTDTDSPTEIPSNRWTHQTLHEFPCESHHLSPYIPPGPIWISAQQYNDVSFNSFGYQVKVAARSLPQSSRFIPNLIKIVSSVKGLQAVSQHKELDVLLSSSWGFLWAKAA